MNTPVPPRGPRKPPPSARMGQQAAAARSASQEAPEGNKEVPEGDKPAAPANVMGDVTNNAGVIAQGASQEQAQNPQSYKMFVSFVVQTTMGPRFGSMTLSGIPDILTAGDLQAVSTTLSQQMQVDNITLLFWKHLYA